MFKISNLKVSTFLILFFSFFYSFSQSNHKINYIRFSYKISNIVFSDVDVTINEDFSSRKVKYHMDIVNYDGMTKISRRKTLNEEDFKKIVEALNRLKISEIIENFETGLDGTHTEIEFGTFFYNTINLKLWGVHKSQKETTLKSFIEVVELILDFAKIKIEDYN
ncbi:hypothetical protein [Flavobacterium okayamense]|uniref:Uncharacterized protein n=1 Tax=Flavobacterium okayamense TaxID=2830782 RepID=A0ABM7S9D7_9FLAO|nr:hypothetical protein [Flavobacterium okayamense]BCY27968.1 hypothetical protein KK2020170_08360 [Flavobacterium okayamense]